MMKVKMAASEATLVHLLQISDSCFPTGGFSHSFGLEAAIRCESVSNKESLHQFVVCSLENTGSFALPFMREAHQQWEDIAALVSLDSVCEACMSNHVAKRASTRQGKSMLDTCSRVFTTSNQSLRDIARQLPHKHQPIIFGAVCGMLGIDLHSAMTTFLFSTIRTIVASAVRLDRVGPIEAQAIQAVIQKLIPDVIHKSKQQPSDEACLVYPHIDIIQNTHDTMFTKLFYS